jgi:hypothetical protein
MAALLSPDAHAFARGFGLLILAAFACLAAFGGVELLRRVISG